MLLIKDTLDRHSKAALMFSGGKDSVATLLLLRAYWDKLVVIWVNTGNMFPENEAIVREHAALVPHFKEVKTDMMDWRSKFGPPSDITPKNWTHIGHELTSSKPIKIASAWDCCAANIWWPAMAAVRETGATLIIRGQRNQEAAKSPLRSGAVQDGYEYLFPIEDWTHEDVLAYLAEQGFNYPEFFNFEESSLDCMNCTAFRTELKDREEWMKKHHPHTVYENNYDLKKIIEAVESELKIIKESL